MNKYTDEQLLAVFPKLLPKLVEFKPIGTEICDDHGSWLLDEGALFWDDSSRTGAIKDSELLQLCWEAEETLTLLERSLYAFKIISMVISNLDFEVTYCSFSWRQIFHCLHMSWQQRIPPLAAVKGITI